MTFQSVAVVADPSSAPCALVVAPASAAMPTTAHVASNPATFSPTVLGRFIVKLP
jgi:hypothetical protein